MIGGMARTRPRDLVRPGVDVEPEPRRRLLRPTHEDGLIDGEARRRRRFRPLPLAVGTAHVSAAIVRRAIAEAQDDLTLGQGSEDGASSDLGVHDELHVRSGQEAFVERLGGGHIGLLGEGCRAADDDIDEAIGVEGLVFVVEEPLLFEEAAEPLLPSRASIFSAGSGRR